MTLLSPNHNYAADECIAQIPQHHIPTPDEKVRASESFDKSVLVAAHMAALHDAYIMEMATHPVNEVTIKPASPTSSVGGLKPSMLKQLKIGKVHRKRVLRGTLCMKTLCTKSNNGLMVVNVFEDEEGNATPIYLSNTMEGNGGSAQAQQLFPQNSKVAVKEPYLTRLPDGEVVLLVEKTTDLVFLWVPDYVEESGSTTVNGMCENGGDGRPGGRDAFAVDKKNMEEAEIEEKVGKEMNNGNGKSQEDVVADEVKVPSASRELKFEDLMEVTKEKKEKESERVDSDVNVPSSNRDLGLEGLLAMGKVDRDGGPEESNKDGEIVLNGEEKVVTEIKVEGNATEEKLGIPEGYVDAGAKETAASLRVRGNALLARGDLNKAVSMYTCALEKACSDGQKVEEILCSSNRAEVLLRLCRNQAAFDDAEAALKLLQGNVNVHAGELAMAKALFRKGRALMGLHKYEEALQVLQEVLGKAPADRQLREAAIKCRGRLKHALKPGKRQRAAANRKKNVGVMQQQQ